MSTIGESQFICQINEPVALSRVTNLPVELPVKCNRSETTKRVVM